MTSVMEKYYGKTFSLEIQNGDGFGFHGPLEHCG